MGSAVSIIAVLVAVPAAVVALWAMLEKMQGRQGDAAAILPSPVTHNISNSNVNAPLARLFIGYNSQTNNGYHLGQANGPDVPGNDAALTTQ